MRNPYDVKVLIGCEKSRVVAQAFEDLGFDSWSCDIEPADVPSNRHIVGDVRDVMKMADWDLLCVMHPPCTRLCNSGVRWYTEPPTNPPSTCTPKEAANWAALNRDEKLAMLWHHLDLGADLFSDCWNTDIPLVAIENPVMHRYAKERIRNFKKHAMSCQPWEHGHEKDGADNVKKRTMFWLRNLPVFKPTGSLDGSTARSDVHMASPGKNRGAERSKFFPGMARAMAETWGAVALQKMEIAA